LLPNSISSYFRDIWALNVLGPRLNLSGARDVIGHVTICGESVALLVARRTNNRKVVSSMPANVSK